MRIFVNSVYRDFTGYAESSINSILAMDSVGLDLVVRPIFLSGANQTPCDRILELETKPLTGITHVIQHYLPHMFRKPSSEIKNIGVFHYETTSIRPVGWHLMLNNLCDAVVTCSSQNKQMILDSNVKTPTYYVPQAVDTSKFKKNYPALPLGTAGKYVFYAVGDWSYRKNYTTLIRAYLQTFSRRDNVVLVLKTFISGKSPTESAAEIQAYIKATKEKLRKHHVDMYPEILIITDRLSESEMLALHQGGDCFVSVEHGAGVCLPALDAVGFGKEVIAPAWGGHTDFLNNYSRNNSVGGSMVPCFGMDNAACPYTELYTCYEKWFEVDFNSLCQNLRSVYDQRNFIKGHDLNYAERWNYQSVGHEWKKILEMV